MTNGGGGEVASLEEEFITVAQKVADMQSVPSRARVPAFDALVYKRTPPQITNPRRWLFSKLKKRDYPFMFGPPLLAGVLGIICTGRGIPGMGWLSPAQIWETVALISTAVICYSVYGAQTERLGKSADRRGASRAETDLRAKTEQIKSSVLRWLTVATISFVISCVLDTIGGAWLVEKNLAQMRTVDILVELTYVLYVFLLLLTVFLFQSYDLQMAQTSPVHQVTGEAATSLVFASVPVLISMAIILAYLLVITTMSMLNRIYGHGTTIDMHSMREFVGGAIAFQMLVSNIIFVIVSRSFFPNVLLTLSESTKEVEP